MAKPVTRRSLVEVIDKLVAIAPELEEALRNVRESVAYASPENATLFWALAVEIMEERAGPDHPKYAQLCAAMNGTDLVR